MKLNRYSLRRLIESVVNEDDSDASKFKKGEKGEKIRVDGMKTSPDNEAALPVRYPEEIAKKLGMKVSGDYYVWKGSDAETGYSLGSVRYSEGDPYTYEALSGGFYRVMSGPFNKGKRKNGKTIGTTPIGAKFKPGTPPTITISDAISTSFTFNGKDSSNATVKEANVEIAALISTSIAEGNPGMVPEQIKAFIDKSYGTGKVSTAMIETLESTPYAFFGPANSDRQENLAALKGIYNDLAEVKGDRGIASAVSGLTLRGLKVAGDEEGKSKEPAPQPGMADEKLDESLSRGSLLRRRYRRY